MAYIGSPTPPPPPGPQQTPGQGPKKKSKHPQLTKSKFKLNLPKLKVTVSGKSKKGQTPAAQDPAPTTAPAPTVAPVPAPAPDSPPQWAPQQIPYTVNYQALPLYAGQPLQVQYGVPLQAQHGLPTYYDYGAPFDMASAPYGTTTTTANLTTPHNLAASHPATADPYASYGYPPSMGIAVVPPYYGDPTYYQGQPYGAFPAYGAPLPVSAPVLVPPQGPPPPIATAPVPITDWKDRMSERVVVLLARLLDGDEVGVGFGFGLLQKIAREQKFSGDDLDALIAAALKDRTLEELELIDANAKTLLPQKMLADSMRLGIARMLLPMKFIEAVMQGVPERWSIAGDLRNCCNPANWKEPQPTDKGANLMIEKLLERVLDRLSSPKLLLLNQTARYAQDDPAMLVLKRLLKGKYARAIADAETNI